jgi:hypothetical protein
MSNLAILLDKINLAIRNERGVIIVGNLALASTGQSALERMANLAGKPEIVPQISFLCDPQTEAPLYFSDKEKVAPSILARIVPVSTDAV